MTLRLTLDTSCIIAMVRPEEPGNDPREVAAIEQLIDFARDELVELQLAAAYDRDFDRYKTPDGRARQLEWLASAPIAKSHAPGLFVFDVSTFDGPDVLASDVTSERYDAIRMVLNPSVDRAALADKSASKLAKHTSDTDHLIAHDLSGADAFVTLDEKTILVHREALAHLNVAACWPQEALTMVKVHS